MIKIASKRDQFVGVRFTKEEKEVIDDFVAKNETSYNDFIREAIFSYINNIETIKNKININRIQTNIQNFQKILPNLIRDIHNLYKEFEEFKLNKDLYFIT